MHAARIVEETTVTRRSPLLVARLERHGDEACAQRVRTAAATKAKASRALFEQCASAIEARRAKRSTAQREPATRA
jgi:hypothetical protein